MRNVVSYLGLLAGVVLMLDALHEMYEPLGYFAVGALVAACALAWLAEDAA